MTSSTKNTLNVVIILALAAFIYAVPGGGPAAQTIAQALYLAFLAAFAWIASRMYREHRVALYSLGDRNRAIVYGALGVLALTLTATGILWGTSLGSIAWLALVVAALLALFEVFRSARSY
jgi:hypothetical protein